MGRATAHPPRALADAAPRCSCLTAGAQPPSTLPGRAIAPPGFGGDLPRRDDVTGPLDKLGTREYPSRIMPQPTLRSTQRSPAPLMTLSRGLDVLSQVLAADDGASLSELAAAIGLHRATVLRLVRTLAERGYVSADPRGPRYFVGPEVLRHSVKTQASALARLAESVLGDLAQSSQETVAVFVPAWPDLVCSAVAASPQLIRRHREVGDVQPMTRAAVGRAYLSMAPPRYVQDTLEARPLIARTPHTVVDPGDFHRALEEARQLGYAVTFQETNLDMAGLAAPICTPGGALPLGVISVSGPIFRWGRDQMDAFAPKLVEAAQRLGLRAAGGITAH